MQEDFTTINYAEVKIILQEVHRAENFKQLLLITFGFIGDDYAEVKIILPIAQQILNSFY